MPPSRSILILAAHPAFERSRVNRALAARTQGLPGVTLHDLYEAYPELDIDREREQALLLDHDTVVFLHPMFWYSTPAILKEWQDIVLTHGWAYGSAGTALAGKHMTTALTTGAPASNYRADGPLGCTLDDLLRPLELTARLCGMRWLPPFVVHGTNGIAPAGIDAAAERWQSYVETLRDGAQES